MTETRRLDYDELEHEFYSVSINPWEQRIGSGCIGREYFVRKSDMDNLLGGTTDSLGVMFGGRRSQSHVNLYVVTTSEFLKVVSDKIKNHPRKNDPKTWAVTK